MIWRVRCGWCHKVMWLRHFSRHERTKHAGFAPFALLAKGRLP